MFAFLTTIKVFFASRLALLALIPGVGLLGSVTNLFAAVISFFSSRLGQWVLIGLVGVGLFIAGDVHRYRADNVKIQAMLASAKAQAEARDKQAKADAQKDVAQRLEELQKLNADIEAKVTNYEKELSARADAACRLNPDDVKRLRKL